MRVFATILICSASLWVVSCAGRWSGDDEATAPLTPELTAAEDDGPGAPAVAAAPAVVRRSISGRDPLLLAPVGGDGGYLSETFVPKVPQSPTHLTLGDGDATGRRTGRMEPTDDGGWRFVSEAAGDDEKPLEPLTILPNAYLEQMEKIVAARTGGPVVFQISGEVTRYRGAGYLMIFRATVDTPSSATGE